MKAKNVIVPFEFAAPWERRPGWAMHHDRMKDPSFRRLPPSRRFALMEQQNYDPPGEQQQPREA